MESPPANCSPPKDDDNGMEAVCIHTPSPDCVAHGPLSGGEECVSLDEGAEGRVPLDEAAGRRVSLVEAAEGCVSLDKAAGRRISLDEDAEGRVFLDKGCVSLDEAAEGHVSLDEGGAEGRVSLDKGAEGCVPLDEAAEGRVSPGEAAERRISSSDSSIICVEQSPDLLIQQDLPVDVEGSSSQTKVGGAKFRNPSSPDNDANYSDEDFDLLFQDVVEVVSPTPMAPPHLTPPPLSPPPPSPHVALATTSSSHATTISHSPKKSIPSAFVTPATGGVSTLLSDDNITPTPNYQRMCTPQLKAQCARFGVRVLPKRKMIAKLREIYNYTHPLVGRWAELVGIHSNCCYTVGEDGGIIAESVEVNARTSSQVLQRGQSTYVPGGI